MCSPTQAPTVRAKAVQAGGPEPYLVQSLDGLFAATPEAWGGSGEHRAAGFRYDWQGVTGASVRRIAYGAVGWRLLEGFHRAVAAYADAGVNVVVDDMLLDLAVLRDWAHALADAPTLLVSVSAPKPVLLQRERPHASPYARPGRRPLRPAPDHRRRRRDRHSGHEPAASRGRPAGPGAVVEAGRGSTRLPHTQLGLLRGRVSNIEVDLECCLSATRTSLAPASCIYFLEPIRTAR
jgi:chloramphenicol 3-O-phosphotransferase